MHQEEHVVSQIMFLQDVHVEAVRYRVEVVTAYSANEAITLQVLLHRLQLISQFTEGVNNQTLNDGQQNDDDEEEEGDVEDDTVEFIFITIGFSNLITDATTSSDAFVQMEHETGQHVMTLLIDHFILLRDVELPEEVEGDDGVEVDSDGQQHARQDQLFAVVGDRLQDRLQ